MACLDLSPDLLALRLYSGHDGMLVDAFHLCGIYIPHFLYLRPPIHDPCRSPRLPPGANALVLYGPGFCRAHSCQA